MYIQDFVMNCNASTPATNFWLVYSLHLPQFPLLVFQEKTTTIELIQLPSRLGNHSIIKSWVAMIPF